VATLTGVDLAGIGAGTHSAFMGASFAGDTTYALGSGTADLTVSQANTVSPGGKWGLIGGIIAAIVVAGVVAWLVVRRRRTKTIGDNWNRCPGHAQYSQDRPLTA